MLDAFCYIYALGRCYNRLEFAGNLVLLMNVDKEIVVNKIQYQ